MGGLSASQGQGTSQRCPTLWSPCRNSFSMHRLRRWHECRLKHSGFKKPGEVASLDQRTMLVRIWHCWICPPPMLLGALLQQCWSCYKRVVMPDNKFMHQAAIL